MPTQRSKTPQKPAPRRPLVVHMIKQLNSPADPLAGLAHTARPTMIRPLHRPSEPGYGDDVDVWLSIQNDAFWARARPWTRADYQRELEQRSWFRPEHVWLAKPAEADAAVGTVALELPSEPLSGRIHWLAVHSHWRRRGIGRLLVAMLERECRQGGVRCVVLETLGSWDGVIGFYQSLGYQSTHDDLSDR